MKTPVIVGGEDKLAVGGWDSDEGEDVMNGFEFRRFPNAVVNSPSAPWTINSLKDHVTDCAASRQL